MKLNTRKKRIGRKKRVNGGGLFDWFTRKNNARVAPAPALTPVPSQTQINNTNFNEERMSERDSNYLSEEEFNNLEGSANKVLQQPVTGLNLQQNKKPFWKFWGGKHSKKRSIKKRKHSKKNIHKRK